MTWKECDRMSLKKEFILLASQRGTNISELARRYQISRKTAYKWLKRFKAQGPEGLQEQSRKPLHSPRRTPDKQVERIVTVRKAHPCWGGRTLNAYLKRQGSIEVPSPSCIQRILSRQGCIPTRSTETHSWKRFEHPAPNRLWQMDFKGHFAYEQGRCHPLTILDDHSRFVLALEACTNEKRLTTQEKLVEVLRRYGVPERINVDNGQPWGSPMRQARYTRLSLWLIKQGVRISYSRPRHPQTNGKCERFHRTLKSELLKGRYFKSLSAIQVAFDQWRDEYNQERPHQGIGCQVPAERYKSSYRPYQECIEPYEYGDDFKVCTVDSRGRLRYGGRVLMVGRPFEKELLGVRHRRDKESCIEIYFRQQCLGIIDLDDIDPGTLVNIYSYRLLST